MIAINDPWLRLEPVRPADYEALFRTEMAWSQGSAWRFGGATIDFRSYVSSFWLNVLGACAVRRHDGSLLGMVTAYDPDHRNGTVWIMAMAVPSAQGSGLLLVGLSHLITELFHNWPFRVVLAESKAPAYAQFRSSTRRAVVEQGRLTRHLLIDGEFRDLFYLAINRETWMPVEGARYLRRQRRADADMASGDSGQRSVLITTGK
jgi:hypothetical protein